MAKDLTFDEVWDALGGLQGVRALTGAKRTAAQNWYADKQFPAKFYKAMNDALRRRRLSASPTLWDQRSAAEAA